MHSINTSLAIKQSIKIGFKQTHTNTHTPRACRKIERHIHAPTHPSIPDLFETSRIDFQIEEFTTDSTDNLATVATGNADMTI